jgi:HD-GYP domain-containing protein (c-di-GMP phosphodiesterase class II)
VLATGSKLRLRDLDGKLLLALPGRHAADPPWPDAAFAELEDRGQPILELELACPETSSARADATLALVMAILDERLQAELREDEICSELVVSYEHLGFFYDLASQLGEEPEIEAIYQTILRRSAELFEARHAELVIDQDTPPTHRWTASNSAEADPALLGRTSSLRLPLTQDGAWLGTLLLHGGRERYGAQDKKILQAALALARTAERQAGQVGDERGILEGPVAAMVTALEAKHPYRRGHARRVAQLASAIGAAMGMDEASLDELRLGGLLHDLGMVAVHDAIMCKRGRLSAPEHDAVRSHTRSGSEILATTRHHTRIREMVRHHHERWDGRGYPDGLAGDRIPLGCRVLAVADAADAMLSRRSYRDELSVDELRGELEACAGSQFDPHTVRIFIDAVIPKRSFQRFLDDMPWVVHSTSQQGRAP